MVAIMIFFGAMGFGNKMGKGQWLGGTWTGKKYQVNVDKAWDMELQVDVKQKTYTIHYPALGCKGHLQVVSLGKNQAVFIEKMSEGSCLDDGYIIVNKTGEQYLSFTCLRDNNTRLASYATLEKKRLKNGNFAININLWMTKVYCPA